MPQWEYCKLCYDSVYVSYVLYQQDGPHTIQRPYTDALWSWCLSTLGLIGWEATGTIGTVNMPTWYFKRQIDPSNDSLQF